MIFTLQVSKHKSELCFEVLKPTSHNFTLAIRLPRLFPLSSAALIQLIEFHELALFVESGISTAG